MYERLFWTEAMYGTGNATIDDHHQKLFVLINTVIDDLENNAPATTLSTNWHALVDFTKMHFTCEEDIMEKKKCSACDTNKKAHHAFLREIEELHAELKISGVSGAFTEKFYKFVASWLRKHIMIIDVKLRETA